MHEKSAREITLDHKKVLMNSGQSDRHTKKSLENGKHPRKMEV